jgi:hypothetical protein
LGDSVKALPGLVALAALASGLALAQAPPTPGPGDNITIMGKEQAAPSQNSVSEDAQTVCPIDQAPPNGFACGVIIYEVAHPKKDPKRPAADGPQFKLRPIFRVTYGTNESFDQQHVGVGGVDQVVANDPLAGRASDTFSRIQVLALTFDGHVAYANTDDLLIPAEGGLVFRGVLGLETEAKRFCAGASVQKCADEHLRPFDYRGRLGFCAAEEIWGSGAPDIPLAHNPLRGSPLITSTRSQCAKRG